MEPDQTFACTVLVGQTSHFWNQSTEVNNQKPPFRTVLMVFQGLLNLDIFLTD